MATLGTVTSAIISRSGAPGLELHDPAAGLTIYGKTYFSEPTLDRMFEDSDPCYDFENILNVRETNGTWTLNVGIQGTDNADLLAKEAVIKAAFRQWQFTLTVTKGGITRTWRCLAADINHDSRDRDLDAIQAGQFFLPLIFSGPHMGPA